MSRLSVNIDHIATLRQLRGTKYPDPVLAAYIAELGGADGITTHLRQDRRHIQDRDLFLLRQTVSTHLTLEMAPTEGMVQIALKAMPDMVTLVPERGGENTTERGFNLEQESNELEPILSKLQDSEIEVSLFIDPTETNVRIAAEIGSDFVELNTTFYSDAEDFEKELTELDKIEKSATLATKQKLGVAVGHALDYQNVTNIAAIESVEEFSIGHSIICRAALVGMERAVREMNEIIQKSSQK
ncbi:pyridoxine 5'-phosphate synthase [bacterium]|nr:pyridoxine 5'-phosphate synthase [bacterium]RKZ26568.1 MAG: pyridoxine 5'-phosphate synthase [bacterium]